MKALETMKVQSFILIGDLHRLPRIPMGLQNVSGLYVIGRFCRETSWYAFDNRICLDN